MMLTWKAMWSCIALLWSTVRCGDHVNHSITANESALEKTHFGRIDYLDQEKGEQYRLYIGKHGITKKCNRYCNYGLESSGRFDLL